MNNIELGSNEVICQKWEEAEQGWGTRPDGFSLHLSFNSLERYIRTYWDSMPDSAPSEYSRPDGTPYPLGVNEETYTAVRASDTGLRIYDTLQYPGSGGINGWMPLS